MDQYNDVFATPSAPTTPFSQASGYMHINPNVYLQPAEAVPPNPGFFGRVLQGLFQPTPPTSAQFPQATLQGGSIDQNSPRDFSGLFGSVDTIYHGPQGASIRANP